MGITFLIVPAEEPQYNSSIRTHWLGIDLYLTSLLNLMVLPTQIDYTALFNLLI